MIQIRYIKSLPSLSDFVAQFKKMKLNGPVAKERMIGRIKELYDNDGKLSNDVDPLNDMLVRGFDRIRK